jgi:hypothetical protein
MTTCRYSRDAEDYLTPDGEPCAQPHCRICSHVHHDGTCPECLARIREDMREIARLCGKLPEETEHRGVNGEAMMLLGPAADPEALGHVQASIAAGRLPADYLDHATGEHHPLFVLGTWDMVVRDALEHDDPGERVTIGSAREYLDRQLTYLGGFAYLPIEDLARDVRTCRAHLEAVLHDGEQRDTGAPCMTCNVPLRRVWGRDEGEDGWRCPRCKETSTEAQYRFAVAHLHRKEATELTDRDMEIRTGVKAGTIRVWARRGYVARRLDSGRTLYCVADVEARARLAEVG